MTASSEAFLRDAFRLLKLAGPGLRASGATFITVARLDGAFGLANKGLLFGPVGGGLAGLAKTASHEWPEVRCRALDIDPTLTDVTETARLIYDEMRHQGPTEVGITARGRCTIELRETPFQATKLGRPLAKGDVLVVTGGARGVTAEVAIALAREYQPRMILLGRSPLPTAEPDWLVALQNESEIKRALLTQNGKNALPREIDSKYRQIAANREALRNLARIAAAGGTVGYRQVDVRDDVAMANTLAAVTRELGPICGIIHGAGVLADAMIQDKSVESFDLVFQTKVHGLRSLLQAVPIDGLKLLVLFSSSTARFGRTAQVDYAVANEVLNKMAVIEAQRRPGCRVVSVNWGPWDGGMVTPGLKQIFANEGVGLIPTEAGANYLLREIAETADPRTEVVVLGGKGLPTPPSLQTSTTSMSLVFDRELSLDSVPILRSHVIDGRAVLPMAITLEWLAHGALHGQPGLMFHGIDGLRVQRGVFVEPDRSYPVRIYVGKPSKTEGQFVVSAELRGGPLDREVVHARANVILSDRLPKRASAFDTPKLGRYQNDKASIYSRILFHGTELQAVNLIEGYSDQGISAAVDSAPLPSNWMNSPPRNTWLADPLVIDAAFQAMIVWSFERHGAGSLPCYLGQYRQYRRTFPKNGLRVVARIIKDTPQLAVADIAIFDASGDLVATIEGYECVIDASLNQAFRRNRPTH